MEMNRRLQQIKTVWGWIQFPLLLLLLNDMDTITDLIVHDKLLTATTLDPAAVIAEAQTQEVLRELDPDYKAKLIHFLYNTRLINNDYHVISMAKAYMQDAFNPGTTSFSQAKSLSGAIL